MKIVLQKLRLKYDLVSTSYMLNLIQLHQDKQGRMTFFFYKVITNALDVFNYTAS